MKERAVPVSAQQVYEGVKLSDTSEHLLNPDHAKPGNQQEFNFTSIRIASQWHCFFIKINRQVACRKIFHFNAKPVFFAEIDLKEVNVQPRLVALSKSLPFSNNPRIFSAR